MSSDDLSPGDSSGAYASSADSSSDQLEQVSVEWTKLLGSTEEDISWALTTGLDGQIYIAGYTYGDLDGKNNSGGEDAFISKLDVGYN